MSARTDGDHGIAGGVWIEFDPVAAEQAHGAAARVGSQAEGADVLGDYAGLGAGSHPAQADDQVMAGSVLRGPRDGTTGPEDCRDEGGQKRPELTERWTTLRHTQVYTPGCGQSFQEI